ncbi:hypothetical protein BBJ28_00021562 [Nothophytophthora sp. Chile5]|nr:hypothetical protein BBJ28_00021562 [Nothophytophthora sp. Chile5]
MNDPTATEADGETRVSIPDAASVGNEGDDDAVTVSTVAASQATNIEESDLPVLIHTKSKRQIARRHSTQMASGTVYPIQEVGDESTHPWTPPKMSRHRSAVTRGSPGLLLPRMPLFAGVSREGSGPNPPTVAVNPGKPSAGNAPNESPYEEMMVRFQIRQLQRPTSTRIASGGLGDRHLSVDSSSDRDGNAIGGGRDVAGGNTDSLTARTMTGQLRSSILASEQHSMRSLFDEAPGRVSSQFGADRASFSSPFVDGRPPLQSGVSSDQLETQFNLSHNQLDGLNRQKTWQDLLAPTPHTVRLWQRFASPLSPFSAFSQARHAVVLLAAATYVLCFPLQLAFPKEQQFKNIDAAVGVLFGLNILATLHTGYVTLSGAVVTSHRLIFWRYIKTRFALDMLSSVTLIIRLRQQSEVTWLHLLLDTLSMERLEHVSRFMRVIWLMRANQSGNGNSFWAWLLYSRYSHLLRIAGIVTVLIGIAHYIACIWTVLLADGDDTDAPSMPWRDRYVASFYAALLLLQGEGVPAETVGQNLFASLSVLVGSVVLAVVFGHVAILVSNFNANFTSYQRKMEAVFAMTAKLQLPAPLRERIHEYYEHLWHEYECLDGEIVQFSKELSHTLGLEVVLFKYMEVVMHVPFWKDCTPDFQKQLMLRLNVRVYLPDDFIMREGEVDDEFYMVNRGYCELSRAPNRYERVTNTSLGHIIGSNGVNKPGNSGTTGRNGGTMGRNGGMSARRRSANTNGWSMDDGYRQSAYELDAAQRRYYSIRGSRDSEVMISRGQAFGDLALVMNYQRAANVRAITHVEMCVLSRDAFQAVLTRYPEDRHRVIVDMLTSYMQGYEMTQSWCPLLELVRTVYSPKAVAAACAAGSAPPPLFPPVLTPRQAAERIYTAINVELQDTTLRFGVGVGMRQQLIDLRERRRHKRELQRQAADRSGKTPGAAPTASRMSSGSLHSETTAETSASSSGSLLAPPMTSASSVRVPTQAPIHGQPQAAPPLTWQERFQQVGEREVAILRAVQELQASFRELQAQRPPPASAPPISRKRGAPGDEAPAAIPKKPSTSSRMPLMKRMGSLVGVPSGNSLDTKNQHHGSSTHYADQLFQTHNAAPQSMSMSQLGAAQQQQQRGHLHLQPLSRMLSTEPESDLSASEVAAAITRERGHVTASAQAVLSPPSESVALRRKFFQRTHSQSLRTLVDAEAAPNTQRSGSIAQVTGAGNTAVPAQAVSPPASELVPLRRKLFQRTHNQSLRALADAVAAPLMERSSISSISQAPIFRRMGTFVAADTNSQQQDIKESPTRYADELFRQKPMAPTSDQQQTAGLVVAAAAGASGDTQKTIVPV